MAVSRHGINRGERGPLMKCSFEEMVEMLMDAAMFSEDDFVRGVSENVMLGQLAPIGGNEFDLYIDEERLHDAKSLIYPHMNTTNRGLDSPGGKADGAQGGTPGLYGGPERDNMQFAAPQTGDSILTGVEFSPDSAGARAISPFSPVAGEASPSLSGIGLSSPAYSEQFRKPESAMSPAGAQSPSYDLSSATSLFRSEQGAGSKRGALTAGFATVSGRSSPDYSVSQTSGSPDYSAAQDSGLDFSPTTSPAYSGGDGDVDYSPTSPMYSHTSQQSASSNSPLYSAADSSASKSPEYSQDESVRGGAASGAASSAASAASAAVSALSPGTAVSPSGVLLQAYVAVPEPSRSESPSPPFSAEAGLEPLYPQDGGDVLDDLGLGEVTMPDATQPGEATVGLDQTEGLPEDPTEGSSGPPPGSAP